MSPWIVSERAPRLKAVFEKYDDIIKKAGYTQFKYSALSHKLAALLRSKDLPLVYGRMVNRRWLATELGLGDSSAIVNTPALKDLVNEKDAQLLAEISKGVTAKKFRLRGVTYANLGVTPYSEKHQRVFSFEEFRTAFGVRGTERIASGFIEVAGRFASAKAAYLTLLRFLRWLIANRSQHKEIILALRDGREPPKLIFERAAFRYQQSVIAEARKAAGPAKSHRKVQLAVIEHLAGIGIFPPFQLSRARSRVLGPRSKARRSFAEAPSVAADTDLILEITRDSALYRGIEFDVNDDARAFALTLARERRSRADLPESLPDAIKQLCDERIDALRAASVRIFLEWHSIFLEGSRALERPGLSGKDVQEALEAIRRSPRLKKVNAAIYQRLFPTDDPGLALRNLLVVIRDVYGSVCPVAISKTWGQMWRHIYARFEGNRVVQPHLAAPSLAVSAALTLYLCESGANVSVALTLEHDSLRPSQLPKHQQVLGVKARAGYKPIYADLPDAHSNGLLSAVSALTLVREAQRHLCDGHGEPAQCFGVFPHGGTMHKLEEWQYRANFKEICACAAGLSDLLITPSMIRPTVLLSAQLSNPGDLSVAQRIAQHSDPSTTLAYVRKLPYRLILEQRIREFQNTIEVIICQDIAQGVATLGYTPYQWQQKFRNAVATGLGVYCANPTTGVQNDYPAGKTCLAIDRCVTCRQLVVVADPNAIAEMILWRDALNVAEGEWLESRYARWQEVWVPWQAFFHVVLEEKMVRGELAAIKSEAQSIVDRQKANPSFRYPSPW